MVNFSDDNWDEGFGLEEEEADGIDEFAPVDPFEDLSARDQDLFFRIVDMLPDDKREATMAYMMDNPRVIRAVVDNAKTKRELIKNNDVEGMKQLLEEENVVLDQIDKNAKENGDFEYPPKEEQY
jgi:hypothetical protein